MAVVVTQVAQFFDQAQPGQYLRYSKLRVTGLVAGNNTVAHGLLNVLTGAGITPLQVTIEPKTIGTSSGNATFYEYQDADATNVYINAAGVGAQAAPFSCELYVTY